MPDSEFRWLSDREFEQLSAEQKYAYIKKLVEHVRASPKTDNPESDIPKARRD